MLNIKVGDKVKSVHHGEGVVDKIDSLIWVIFQQGTFLYYRDGYYFDKESAFREKEPSLSLLGL